MTRFEIWFLTLLMVSLWALMPATQLWDWDEPLYVRTGIEMFEAGNLLLPQFNGEVFAHKPPLGYWLMGLASQILGQSEFAARFLSAPALALSAWLIGRSGALMFNARVGEAAMVIVSTGFMSVYLGAAAMMDAFLLAGYSLCIWVVLKIVIDNRVTWWLLALFALGGLETMLVKGPVGPALIGGMVLATFVFLGRSDRPAWSAFFWLTVAGGVAIAGFVAWFIPANAASGGALADEGVGIHVIGRALSPMEGHGGQGLLGFFLFLPIYIPVIALGIIPWTSFLPGAVGHVFKGMNYRNRVLLLAWFLPTFVAFSIVATKLPHYIFPAFAPLAVAVAAWLDGADNKRSVFGAGLTAALYLLIAAGLVWAAVTFSPALSAPLVGVAALAFVGMGLLVWRVKPDLGAVPYLALAGVAAMQVFYWGGLREIEGLAKLSRPLGQAIQANVPEDAPLYMGRYREPSLVFYADRPVQHPILPVAPEELTDVVTRNAVGYAVLTKPEKKLLEEISPDWTVTVLAQQTARNFNQNAEQQSVFLLKWQHALD